MACTGCGWADLPLDLVGDVMAYLRLPADRARFAFVCRAWRSAARQFASRMPWILLPSGNVCATIGHDAAVFRIPGLPEKTTCLAATDDWLVLDCTDDTCRRTPFWDNYCPDTGTFKDDPRPDVKHRHTYRLYNLFSNVAVPLPELDAVIGHVTETFEVRKVLMRSSSTPDDIIAITTNHREYNVILCRPGKGTFVVPCHNYKVIDITFVGDTLYGITMSEELLAFHLGEDEDGRPNLTRFERAISCPLLDDHDYSGDGEVVLNSSEESDDDEEEPHHEEEEEEMQEDNEEDEESDEEEAEGNNESDDDEAVNQAWHNIVDDGCTLLHNEKVEGYEYEHNEEEGPYEPKDLIFTGIYLVQSCSGELLLVRHQRIIPPKSDSYTMKVEVFKADLCAGKWASSNGLAKGEAVFLSRSVSKCTRVCGDTQEGFVYCAAHLLDVFDMTSFISRQMTFKWPWQRIRREYNHFLSWFFPPKELIL